MVQLKGPRCYELTHEPLDAVVAMSHQGQCGGRVLQGARKQPHPPVAPEEPTQPGDQGYAESAEDSVKRRYEHWHDAAVVYSLDVSGFSRHFKFSS